MIIGLLIIIGLLLIWIIVLKKEKKVADRKKAIDKICISALIPDEKNYEEWIMRDKLWEIMKDKAIIDTQYNPCERSTTVYYYWYFNRDSFL